MGEGLVDKLQREADLDLHVTWHPFELHPETPAAGVELTTYFGIPPERLQQMEASLRARAVELGLPLSGRRMLVNTHQALLLSEWARQQSPAQLPALHRALFRAYFAEGHNLADAKVLRAVCAEAGLPADRALAQMQDSPYEHRLAESMARAHGYGVTGVPAFIINSRKRIGGALPYDVLLKALRQIAAEQE